MVLSIFLTISENIGKHNDVDTILIKKHEHTLFFLIFSMKVYHLVGQATQMLRDAARCSDTSKCTRCCQMVPDAAKCPQMLLDAARCSQMLPDATNTNTNTNTNTSTNTNTNTKANITSIPIPIPISIPAPKPTPIPTVQYKPKSHSSQK